MENIIILQKHPAMKLLEKDVPFNEGLSCWKAEYQPRLCFLVAREFRVGHGRMAGKYNLVFIIKPALFPKIKLVFCGKV